MKTDLVRTWLQVVGSRSVHRVDQRRVDDSVILRQQRRAKHASGCYKNPVRWVTVKGIGQ